MNILLSLIRLPSILYCMINKSHFQGACWTNKQRCGQSLYISNYWPRNGYYHHNSRIQQFNLNEKILQTALYLIIHGLSSQHDALPIISMSETESSTSVYVFKHSVISQTLSCNLNECVVCYFLDLAFSHSLENPGFEVTSQVSMHLLLSSFAPTGATRQKQHCIRRLRLRIFSLSFELVMNEWGIITIKQR